MIHPIARCLFLAAALATPVSLTAQDIARLRTDLQSQLTDILAATQVPGATFGVALPDGSSFAVAAGRADTAAGQAMPADGRMLTGSTGKTFFAALAMQLVGEGRLELDAPIARYLGDEPWYDSLPNAPDVTVRMLMNHTSGIVRYELNPAFLEDITADPYREWTIRDRVRYVFPLEPPFAAGQGWTYSDTNYIILAAIMQGVVGDDIYGAIRRRVLEPLELQNTVPSDRPEVPGLVQGYAGVENPFGGFDATIEDGRLGLNPQFEFAGGGYASTAEDLARWVKFIHEGEAFDPGLLDEARDGVPARLGPGARYGLGVIMLELPAGTAWGHSGFMPGYRTEMYYFPEHRFAVALEINSTARGSLTRSLGGILNELAETVVAALD
jgi:D-alanyl-D-alanine carboxypeptidase